MSVRQVTEGTMICDTVWDVPPAEVVFKGHRHSWPRYVPEPPTCTMEPDGWYGEEYGIYKCSNCEELWQFGCDGPKEHMWTCCPRCKATIDYKEES